MKRVKVKKRRDKKYFKRTAERVHKLNVAMPMRGGIRL